MNVTNCFCYFRNNAPLYTQNVFILLPTVNRMKHSSKPPFDYSASKYHAGSCCCTVVPFTCILLFKLELINSNAILILSFGSLQNL